MSVKEISVPHTGAQAPQVRLGTRLRHARLAHTLTLKALAHAAQCSESLVSKVERGLATPSLATLHRLASALQTNISDLTAEDSAAAGPVTRQGHRMVHGPDPAGAARTDSDHITLECLIAVRRGGLLQANVHILQRGARSDGLIQHFGEEMGYVLEGQVRLCLGETDYVLDPGDAFHFSSQTPHGYENVGPGLARILWVNTPATF